MEKKGLAWEYEYYETCNIARKRYNKAASFDPESTSLGLLRLIFFFLFPLGLFPGNAQSWHTLHNPINAPTAWA